MIIRTNSTFKNLIWTFTGTGFQAVLQIMSFIILSRLLLPEEFGIASIVTIIIGFSTMISNFGVGQALIQKTVITDKHVKTGFLISLLSGLLLTFLVYFCSPLIAHFFGISELVNYLRASSIVFFIQSFSSVSESLMVRNMKFKLIAIVQVSTYFVSYSIGIILALNNYGVWAILCSFILQAVMKSIIYTVLIPPSLKFEFDKKIAKELFNFGGGYTLDYVSNYLALQADNLIIGKWLGPYSLGIYGRAYQLMSIPSTIFGQVIDKVLFSTTAKYQDNKDKLTHTYYSGMSILAVLLLPVSILCYILAPEIVSVVLGDQWEGVIIPFQILSTAILFRTNYKISNSIILAKGAVYQRAIRQFIYFLLISSFTFIGMKWGLAGASVGVFVAIIINFFIMTNLCLKLLEATWKELLSIHYPAFYISSVIIVEVYCLTSLLRFFHVNSIIILGVCGMITACTLYFMLLLLPKSLTNIFLEQIIEILHFKYLQNKTKRGGLD